MFQIIVTIFYNLNPLMLQEPHIH